MEPVQVQMKFELDERSPGKTEIKVRSVRIVGEDSTYAFSEEDQWLENHPELQLLPVVRNSTKNLTKVGHYRNLKVTMPSHITPLYLDTDGNFVFRGNYLLEVEKGQLKSIPASQTISSDLINVMTPHMDKFKDTINLSAVQKSFVLDQFDGKDNAIEWVKMFEKECTRHGIFTDEEKIQLVRLFISGSVKEWYRSSLYKLTLKGKWSDWRDSLLRVFGDKNWRAVTLAYTFRYIGGSYLDYALRKERLLLDIEPDMSEKSRINHIVVGLPVQIQDKLDREQTLTSDSLMNQLCRYSQNYTGMSIHKTCIKSESSNQLQQDGGQRTQRKPCTYCSSLGFQNRYHPVEFCRTKKNASRPENSVHLTKSADEEQQKN